MIIFPSCSFVFSAFTARLIKTRLTLYWQLRKICGPYLTVLYSIVNALMFCFLAGAMIAVAATAVGLPFNMPMPGLNDMYPNSVSWVVVVFIVGAAVTTLAIYGFEKLSNFAKVCSPWMFLVFVAAGAAVLPKLGCTSIGDFSSVVRVFVTLPAILFCQAPDWLSTVRFAQEFTEKMPSAQSLRPSGTPRIGNA